MSERLEPRALLSTLPPDFSEAVITNKLVRPTQMTVADDGRVFITQQYGDLRVVKDGVLKPEPVLHVDVSTTTERGLIGVAVDPHFSDNNFIYVFYTAKDSETVVHNRISRFTLEGDVAVPGSEKPLLDMPPTTGIYHMSGGLAFGTDGMLYISSGDNSFKPNGQSLSNLKGKILRIAPDGTIPPDNPFYGSLAGDLRSIWAYGLRNPFSIAFGRTSGRLFIHDVGNFSFEEINLGASGANFGWADSEGPTTTPGHTGPLYSYAGGPGGQNAATIGGAMYEGVPQQFPASYNGKYFFTDHIRGWIKTIDPVTLDVQDFATGLMFPVNMKLAADGTLYYLQRGDNSARGQLVQIKFAAGDAPDITTQPEASLVSVGKPVAFFVSAAGDPPLSYQWQRNGVDIPGATSQTYTINSASLADDGAAYRARVSNAFGSVTSDSATLTVTSNQSPTAQIDAPAAGTTYVAGESFTFTGSGADPESGALPASSLSWSVDFHHDDHTHPFVAPTPGDTGSFTTDATGETASNVFYRIHLTVTDPAGLTETTFRDVVPVKKTLTLASDPPGIGVKFDSAAVTEPLVGVVGIQRHLEAPETADVGGVLYAFDRWSDGNQSATRDLPFPAQDTTLVARYRLANTGAPPPPPNDPNSTIFEAERGKLTGATKVRAKLTHTGDGFVALNGALQGVAWQVDVAKAGVYSLMLRYAHGETDPLVMNVLDATDTQLAQMNLKPTRSWSLWKTARVRVQLPAGASEVRFVLQSSDRIVHVDSLRIARTIHEAETGGAIGGASVVSNPPAPDGLGFVHLRGKAVNGAGAAARPVAVEWTINAATAGDYGLFVRYANSSADDLSVELLDVTTGATTTLVLPRTPGWSALNYASLTLPLSEGVHKLRLVSSVQSPVVIDSLTVSSPSV